MTGNSVQHQSRFKVGDKLPELKIPITAKLIVGGALSTRDFQDVHHDYARAQQLGSPDIFMNILTTQGLLYRYIQDWAGSDVQLKSLKIKLGVPNYPGDEMEITGRIKELDSKASQLILAIEGNNQLGTHVTAEATIISHP